MGDAVRKRNKTIFSKKNIVLFFIFLFGISSILVTVIYTIPLLVSFIGKHGYISPLASQFTLHEALGTQISKETVREKVGDAGFQIKEITDYDRGYLVALESGEEVLFSKKKPLEEQISSLQLISSRFTIEGKQFIRLDLRFDRPVIVPK